MATFVSKLLKIQLAILFVLTMMSLFSFYFASQLPDNFLSISSSTSESNFISYYATSLLSWVGYYSGPWIFFPFSLFAMFYAFFYTRRISALDLLNFFLLILGFLFLTSFFAPEFLGDGARFVVSDLTTNVSQISLSIIFVLGFLGLSLRKLPKISLIKLKSLSINLPTFESPVKKIMSRDLRMTVPKFLRSEKKVGVEPIDEQPVVEAEEEPVSSFPEINRHKSPNVVEPIKSSDVVPVKKLKRAVKAPANDTQYFEIVTALSKERKVSAQNHPDDNYFQDIIQRIEDKLEEFKIEGQVVDVLKGPVVDTFELELGPGVKVNKVKNAEYDLSMALLGAPIRIVYPMVGRTTVGIEVPRNPREYIYLEEVLSSDEFQNNKHLLPIAMGKDAFGEVFVVDLASLPHMLVAGSTGAGKSVFINSLLVSLLVKRSPAQMKLLLIDPKQLELAAYAKLPHLIMPVVTDAKTAAISLLWACQEMERRYSILKEFGSKTIVGFNEKLKIATPDLIANIRQYYPDSEQDEENYELPFIVVVVDEFADLILNKAGKEIENNINRLAGKARAAGIHLVLATQRPSVDVITGLIKANCPGRVSFRVTSSVDSRTILNTTGAEKLLGKGDMLFKNGITFRRGHSSFVEEGDIESFTSKLAEMGQEFNQEAIEFLENDGEQEQDPYAYGSHLSSARSDGTGEDDLYKEAVQVVIEHRTASASMLQRRLKVGYNRAANLVETMERNGVVGPAEGSKRRKVLISSVD